MRTWRGTVLLGAFAAIGLAVVGLRVEQTRCTARTLALEEEWISVRGELWQVQAAMAGLRAPGYLHERMTWLEGHLVSPSGKRTKDNSTRIAQDKP